MQFGRFFKKAFGFDSSDEEAELEGIDATVVPRRIAGATSSAVSEPQDMVGTEAVADAESGGITDPAGELPAEGVPDAIFTSVVEVFNSALPEFMQRSVDGKSQREYLYEQLNDDMKEYLRRLESDAETRCRMRWEGERLALRKQMEEIQQRARKEEGEREDAKKHQLSAERQKRALSERVHDLERQIASLEAENEQYILENKSLVNKLRITSVTGGAVDADSALVRELEELTEKLQQSDARVKEVEALVHTLEEEKKSLDETLNDVKAGIPERDHRIHDLEASLTESANMVQTLQTEVGKLQEALEQSRVKDDLGDAMLTDLNSKASKAMKEAEELRQSAAALHAENLRLEQEAEHARKLAKNAEQERQEAATELAGLRREQAVMQTRLDDGQAQLQDALKNLAMVEDLSAQLDRLEEAKRVNDNMQRKQREEIAALNEKMSVLQKENSDYATALKQKDDAIRNHEKMADSLRKTIENNLYEHAQAESALRSEIDRLSGRVHMHEHRYDAVSNHADDRDADIPVVVDEALEEPDFVLAPAEKKKEARSKKKKPSISAIDDTIENADWLVAVPAVPSKKPVPPRDDADFGYREPERKAAPPDNPAQMSLW